MIEQEFIMLIMNCKKYAKKAKFQKMTWLPKIPAYLRYYHVIGDESLDTAFKFDDDNNILWVRVADDYNSLPKKVIAAYEAVYDTFQFKYLFKTDDDQILIKPQFFDTIKGLISGTMPPIHYGGYIVDVTQPYLSQYSKIHPELPSHLPLYVTKYCSGRFYFLSKSAISSLINKQELISKEYLEDYAIGFYLDNRFKINMMNISTNKFFTDIEESEFPTWVEQGKI